MVCRAGKDIRGEDSTVTPDSVETPRRLSWIGSLASGDEGWITGATRDLSTGVLHREGAPVPARNASYLARSAAGVVYAVLENPAGEVQAFLPTVDGGLRPLGPARSTGGAEPCHVSVHHDAAYVIVSNYGSGSVAVLPIAADGSLEPATDVVEHDGHGPDNGPRGRQTGPHAHMAVSRPDPAGRWDVLVTDLGIDRVVHYRLDVGAGRLRHVDETPMPPGSGPRHLALRGRYAYVAGELDSTLTVLDLDSDDPANRVVTTIPTVDVDDSFPSAIRLAPNGRWCYVANRGPDMIAVISVDGPVVRVHANVSSRGEQPRDLALSPDGKLLYVANQAADAVRTFRVDEFTGLPTPIGEPLRVSRPSCVLL